MIDDLHQLRAAIDQALAILGRLEPALAAWRYGRGAEDGREALAGPSIPAEAGSSLGGPAAASPEGRQDAPGEEEGTILPPSDSVPPDEPLAAAEGPPRRRRRSQAPTEEERRARQREYGRRAYAKKKAAKDAEAEVAAEAPESAPSVGAGTTLATNGAAPSDAAASEAYGPPEGRPTLARLSLPDADEERDYRRAGREPPRVSAALALPEL